MRLAGITGYYEGGELLLPACVWRDRKDKCGNSQKHLFMVPARDSVDMKYGTTSGKNLAYWLRP